MISAKSDSGQRHQALQEAVAPLVVFDPSQLLPGAPDDAALAALLGDCELVYDERHTPQLALRDEVRAAALRRLGSAERALAVAEGSPARQESGAQRLLEAYLRGSAPPLEAQSRAELALSLRAGAWLEGLLPDPPDAAAVQARIDLESLVEPLRHLADASFVGRSAELARLHAYLREPRAPDAPPLMVTGVGGVGKSTLLAKFLIEVTELPEAERPYFARLDFDRPDVSAAEPDSLLIELARQVARQLPPGPRASLLALRDGWLEVRRYGAGPPASAVKGFDVESFAQALERPRAQLIEAYGGLSGGRKLLLVLDTFEEAQKQHRERVADIMGLLAGLARELPGFRAILAGRVPPAAQLPAPPPGGRPATPTALQVEELPLDNLAEADARALLAKAAGLTPELAALIVGQVGRSPLSLRLAATLARQERDAGRDISRGLDLDRFLRAVHDQDLQAVLYWRILDHLGEGDPDLRRLAHPGLALRRITPGLIREVLAGPCELGEVSPGRADELFAGLAGVVDLVQIEAGAIVHRPDVRRMMLRLLQRDKVEQTAAIHQAAASYYAARPDLADRTEELYHRLMLDEERAALDARWSLPAGRPLGEALEELPPRAQNYLAGQLGLDLPDELRALGDLEAWERQVAPRARELLGKGRAPEALKLIGERPGRSAFSPLYELEARALRELRRYAEGLAAARAGIAAFVRQGSSRSLMRLTTLAAGLAELAGELAAAIAHAGDALELAERFADPAAQLEAATLVARLTRRSAGEAGPILEPGEAARIAPIIERGFAQLTAGDYGQIFRERPDLLRAAAAELGGSNPALLAEALTAADFAAATYAQRRALAGAFAGWDEATQGMVADWAELRGGLRSWRDLFERGDGEELRRMVAPLIRERPAPAAVRGALADLLRPPELVLVPGAEQSRNTAQLQILGSRRRRSVDQEQSDVAAMFSPSLAWASRAYGLHHRAADGRPEGPPLATVYLFNLLVAFEWDPEPEERAEIEAALRRAGAALYRRSGGRLAFGQVLFAGADLMASADIQIRLGGRTQPQATPAALQDAGRFAPIRIGRRHWDARAGVEKSWDDEYCGEDLAELWLCYAIGLTRGPRAVRRAAPSPVAPPAEPSRALLLPGARRAAFDLGRAAPLARERLKELDAPAPSPPPDLPLRLPVFAQVEQQGFGFRSAHFGPRDLPEALQGRRWWVYTQGVDPGQYTQVGPFGHNGAYLPGHLAWVILVEEELGIRPEVYRFSMDEVVERLVSRDQPGPWPLFSATLSRGRVSSLLVDSDLPQFAGWTLRYPQPEALARALNADSAPPGGDMLVAQKGASLIPGDYVVGEVGRSGEQLHSLASSDGVALLLSGGRARSASITRMHHADAAAPPGGWRLSHVYAVYNPAPEGEPHTLVLHRQADLRWRDDTRWAICRLAGSAADRWEPLPSWVLPRGGEVATILSPHPGAALSGHFALFYFTPEEEDDGSAEPERA